jgi:ubiquinone/menaquinone biosynthesis C-methylase UbiE
MSGCQAPAAEYREPAAYDGFMGRWSAALAPLFLGFALRAEPRSLLDVGVGTGTLLAAAAAAFPKAKLTGIDPSPDLLASARSLANLATADLREATAESLPFPDESFDACLCLLVLQEFPDVPAALREMKRVTRQGGGVASCHWDFAKMPVIVAFRDALAALDPSAAGVFPAVRPYQDEAALAAVWKEQGFRDVSTRRIEVSRRYRDFDEVWQPLLTGPTPSTRTIAALPTDTRDAVRTAMQAGFATGSGGFTLKAEALAVRGIV